MKEHTHNFDPFLVPYTTQNASQNLNVKPKAVKFLQKIIRENLVTLVQARVFQTQYTIYKRNKTYVGLYQN